jgi:hypothetical protein
MKRRTFFKSAMIAIAAALFRPFAKANMPAGHFSCPYCGRPVFDENATLRAPTPGTHSGWCAHCCPIIKGSVYPQMTGVWAYHDQESQRLHVIQNSRDFSKMRKAVGLA